MAAARSQMMVAKSGSRKPIAAKLIASPIALNHTKQIRRVTATGGTRSEISRGSFTSQLIRFISNPLRFMVQPIY